MSRDSVGPQQLVARIRVEIEAIKGSRFIATACGAVTEEEAKSELAQVRAQMPGATHHCSAWRLATPSLERANDDGEPGGSAGRPILAALQGRDVVNAAVVVTRFYGGTKLGVGGLVRAYGAAAAAALDASGLEAYVPKVELRITHAYADADAVARMLEASGATENSAIYGTDVRREISIARDRAASFRAQLRDATRGQARVEALD